MCDTHTHVLNITVTCMPYTQTQFISAFYSLSLFSLLPLIHTLNQCERAQFWGKQAVNNCNSLATLPPRSYSVLFSNPFINSDYCTLHKARIAYVHNTHTQLTKAITIKTNFSHLPRSLFDGKENEVRLIGCNETFYYCIDGWYSRNECETTETRTRITQPSNVNKNQKYCIETHISASIK